MIQEFITRIKSVGLARTNRYKVEIAIPNSFPRGKLHRSAFKDIPLLCDGAAVPGINIESTAHRIFGESREMPYGVSYNPITLNFYMDASLKLKKLFDDWMGLIVDPISRSIGYYDDYRTIIGLTLIDVQESESGEDVPRYKIELVDAWPKTVSDIQLGFESREVMRLPVTFQYKFWRQVPLT